MGDFVHNIAKGRATELYNRVDGNDPANSAFIVVAINTTETDDNLKRLDTLALVLANVNTAEVTNTGYARLVLTDAELAAWAPDDVNDRVDLDIPDPSWASVAAGGGWTDLMLCYDADTTSGTDANIIPMTQHDFARTPDGSAITANVPATGFLRAS